MSAYDVTKDIDTLRYNGVHELAILVQLRLELALEVVKHPFEFLRVLPDLVHQSLLLLPEHDSNLLTDFRQESDLRFVPGIVHANMINAGVQDALLDHQSMHLIQLSLALELFLYVGCWLEGAVLLCEQELVV